MAPFTIPGMKKNDLKILARIDNGSEVEGHTNDFRTLFDELRAIWTAEWEARYIKYYFGVLP